MEFKQDSRITAITDRKTGKRKYAMNILYYDVPYTILYTAKKGNRKGGDEGIVEEVPRSQMKAYIWVSSGMNAVSDSLKRTMIRDIKDQLGYEFEYEEGRTNYDRSKERSAERQKEYKERRRIVKESITPLK